ncbi:MAG: pyridoxamine 5'-phosphate oxidase family protein [Gammaproteobacteria bacterium]
MVYHPGELEVQQQAGVRSKSERIGKTIATVMPAAAQEFLRHQPFAVLSSVDAQGGVWVSVLAGQAGFLHAEDGRTLAIDAAPMEHDPLRRNLQSNPSLGLLAIELATRRRMRVNGQGSIGANNYIKVHTEQVYANCPKYIQARQWEIEETVSTVPTVQQSNTLNAVQQTWIQHADTFFIGSFHPEGGADVSHRGGNPGFIKVLDEKTLLWPDYIGNNMFNTLGNIAAYPNAGLLFMDFDQGATLQLTGSAQIVWDIERMDQFPGAQRMVEFCIARAVETRSMLALRWQFGDYSPYNP